MKTKACDETPLMVSRETWSVTVLRLMRAEQKTIRTQNLLDITLDASQNLVEGIRKERASGLEYAKKLGQAEAELCLAKDEIEKLKTDLIVLAEAGKPSMDIAKAAGIGRGREDVLRLIARWGKCRPLEGLNGEQMAEALRKVLMP